MPGRSMRRPEADGLSGMLLGDHSAGFEEEFERESVLHLVDVPAAKTDVADDVAFGVVDPVEAWFEGSDSKNERAACVVTTILLPGKKMFNVLKCDTELFVLSVDGGILCA